MDERDSRQIQHCSERVDEVSEGAGEQEVDQKCEVCAGCQEKGEVVF